MKDINEAVCCMQKPKCQLIGQNGNIFNLMAIASSTLKQAGMKDKMSEMLNRVQNSNSYEEALSVICEYVEVY